MKFKMAPNSLFAVLLRSPWWISFAIALAVATLAMALLPQDLRTAGALGCLPFVVIGCMALWRQLRAPSAGQAQAILDAVGRMPWAQFCRALEQGFASQGFRVQPGQGAADLRLEREGRTTLVSAKRWKAARHGEESLQALQEAVREADASRAVYVALGELSPNAQRFAKAQGIELLQGSALVLLLRDVKLSA